MGASNPSRFLDTAGTTARGIALTPWGGSVLKAFRQNTAFYDMLGSVVAHQSVTHGKSWEWPIIGEAPLPEYHIPGNELLGQTQLTNKVTVSIDDILVSHREIPLDQRRLSHFDIMSPYLDDMGKSLAIDLDSKIAIMTILAARTAASTGYHYGGTRIGRTGSATISTAYPATPAGAASFADDLLLAGQIMDEKFVPKAGRMAFITPYMERVLFRDQGYVWGTPSNAAAGGPSMLFSNDYPDTAGNSVHRRVIRHAYGFDIHVTPNIPDTDFSSANIYGKAVTLTATSGGTLTTATNNRAALDSPTNPTKYQVNCDGTGAFASGFGKPVALLLAPGSNGQAAVAMVDDGMGFEHADLEDIRRNTLFTKTQNFFGLGVLAPWYAGEICVSAT